MRCTVIVALAGALCAHATVSAAITSYSSRAAFTSAAGSVSTQDFNSFAAQANAFEGVSFDFGDFSALNGVNASNGGDITSPGDVNGTTAIAAYLGIGGSQFSMTFDHPITALGFDANNVADQRFDDFLFNNGAGDVVAVHDPIDQTRFWGFISDTPFTTLTVRQVSFGAGGTSTDGFRVDDVTYSVPSPGVVVVLGAAGTLWRRGR